MPITHKIFKHVTKLICTLLMFSISACVQLKEEQTSKPIITPEFTFLAYDNDEERVVNTLLQAKQNNKLALIVLGAQWCHDSRGFANKLTTADMQEVLDSKFEVVFVDVGAYKDKRNITHMFNYPIYFGTPTVLVVDPKTNKLLNEASIAKWHNAYSVPVQEYVDYFTTIGEQQSASLSLKSKANPTWNDRLLAAFELKQSQRLMDGYNSLAPMLIALDAKKLYDKKEFNRLWKEVKVFRTQLQKDILRLRQETNNANTQKHKKLIFPTYPSCADKKLNTTCSTKDAKFTWE